MADDKQLAKLKEGVSAWNEWREANPSTPIDLTDADLTKADLDGVDLSDADLTGAKVKDRQSLISANVSRAILYRCKYSNDALISMVSESSQRLARILMLMLAATGYALLTVAGTRDLEIVQGSRVSTIPMINLNMPIIAFAWIVPIILLAVFGFFHVNLSRHWKIVSRLPTRFSDGTYNDDMVYPWLVNSMARRPRSGFSLSIVVSYFLAFLFLPIEEIFNWIWFLKRQDNLLTGWHVLVCSGVVLIAFFSLAKTNETLSRKGRTLSFVQCLGISALMAVFLSFVSWCLLHSGTGVSIFRAYVDLSNLSVTQPGDPPHGDELNYLRPVNLREAKLRFAVLEGTDLRRCNLEKADLSGARLLGTKLQGANLRDANLQDTMMERVYLDGADLEGARFSNFALQGSFVKTKFKWAKLDSGILKGDFQEAEFGCSKWQKVGLGESDLSGADFSCPEPYAPLPLKVRPPSPYCLTDKAPARQTCIEGLKISGLIVGQGSTHWTSVILIGCQVGLEAGTKIDFKEQAEETEQFESIAIQKGAQVFD